MKTTYIELPDSDDLLANAIADVVDASDLYGPDVYVLTRISTTRKARGRGLASRLLKRVCQDADDEQVELWLNIEPSDGLNYDQLSAWYQRNGFVPDAEEVYRRKPQQRMR